MRKRLLSIGVGVLLLGAAAPGYSGPVNCGIVNKDLKMGRTAQDIAERMMISVDDVKKCEAEAPKDGGGAAAAPAAGDKAPAAATGGGAADTHAH